MTDAVLYNGYSLPRIGYGTFPHKEELITSVPDAVSAGIRLFDTSDNYENEEWLGRGLEVVERRRRGQLVIVSKFSQPTRTDDLFSIFITSQRKINAPVDVYLLHWPYPFLWKKQWKRMEHLYKAKKCKAIGVCNFNRKHLNKLLKHCEIKPMINQIELHPLFQQRDITQFCQQNGIQVMSYSPLARNNQALMDNATIKSVAKKHGKTVSQIVLRWNIEHSFIPIPTSKSRAHIKENMSIFDFALSDEEIRAIDALDRGMRVRFDPEKRFTTKQKLVYFVENILLSLGISR